jgi:hypothetical protein
MAFMEKLKNTYELLKLFIILIRGGYKSAEDGKFNWTDIGNFFGLIQAAPEGITDAGKTLEENINASREDHESMESAVEAELMQGGDVPADIAYDVSKVMSGTLGAIRLGMKIGRKQGKDEGERAVLQDIKDGKLSIEDIEKMEL